MISDRLRTVRGFVSGIVVASVLGVGGLAVVGATTGSSSASSYIPITPTRILDTRQDLGLFGVNDGVPGLLKVAGLIPTLTSSGVVNAIVVPEGATAVVLNVTAVNPTSGGYVSLRPGDAVGSPQVSTLNVQAGGVFPNAATITLPSSGNRVGEIQVWFEAEGTSVGSTELLIDIAGYYELASAAPAGAQGPAGASSATGFTARSVCGLSGSLQCSIGERGPGGGWIFFVDTLGEYSDFDYLEAAPADYPTQSPWVIETNSCGPNADLNCRYNFISDLGSSLNYLSLGSGRLATAAIVARHDLGNVARSSYAAGLATTYSTSTSGDWYLPSITELKLMYLNLKVGGIGNFINGTYLSSSENTSSSDRLVNFTVGNEDAANKTDAMVFRPVRSF